MNIALMTESRLTAVRKYNEYSQALRRHREPYLKQLRRAYWHAKQGRALVNVKDVIVKAGLNEKGDPKLAIARADMKEVHFRKWNNGNGTFKKGGRWGSDIFSIPEGAFSFPMQKAAYGMEPKREIVGTKVPIIPPTLLPAGQLERYWILFEVEDWDIVNGDPILLARINRNLFVVLATWELTDIEKAVVDGRL